MERAAFMIAWREKKLKGLLMVATAAAGSAATRIETFVVSTGTSDFKVHSPWLYGS
jgi:hypothetical protein